MSLLIQNILKGIDYQRVIDIRIENFNYVAEKTSSNNKINIDNKAGLFFYPLLIDHGNLIKKKLIERKIYVPTLWPNVLHESDRNTVEYYYADNIIFLPIDQRYGLECMKYMVNILNSVKEE
jgi:hypothetical protein